MRRRSFLKSAASALPLALAPHLAEAAAQSATAATPELHPLHPGEDRFGETHTRGFNHMAFKVATADTAGNLFVIEEGNLKGGGPPLHSHDTQEEFWFVLEGEILFQVGDRRITLKAGESILGPRDVPHAFLPVSDTPARMIIAYSPAGHMEQFFRDTDGPNPPLQDAAFMRRYGMKLAGKPITRA